MTIMARAAEWLLGWHAEDEGLRMRAKAERYAQRAEMDGHVIQKTGEVVRKESV